MFIICSRSGGFTTLGGCCGVLGCCLAGVLGVELAEDEEDVGIANLMASIRLATNRHSWSLASLCFS